MAADRDDVDVAWLWLVMGLVLLGWGAAAAWREPDPQPWFCVALDVVLTIVPGTAFQGWSTRPAGALRLLAGTLSTGGAVAWLWLNR